MLAVVATDLAAEQRSVALLTSANTRDPAGLASLRLDASGFWEKDERGKQ